VTSVPGSPTDRLLTAFLVLAPLAYLVADVLYAARGWDDATAGVVHVLAATAYALVVLRVVTWTEGRLAAVLLLTGVVGAAGNVAYGFNTIHVSLGDTDLVDAAGAASLIKPYGLLFPLSLLLAAFALRRRADARVVGLVALAAVAWPVAHVGNVAWLAVAVNLALLAGFAALAAQERSEAREPGTPVARP
jgi:hypothetical protein